MSRKVSESPLDQMASIPSQRPVQYQAMQRARQRKLEEQRTCKCGFYPHLNSPWKDACALAAKTWFNAATRNKSIGIKGWRNGEQASLIRHAHRIREVSESVKNHMRWEYKVRFYVTS